LPNPNRKGSVTEGALNKIPSVILPL
jgi:hypothetical protein